MGVFKEIKDMKSTVHDAPARIEQAQQMASARALNTSYQARVAAAPGDFEPIAAVSLELYAQISKSLATIDYDLSRSIRLAEDKGVSGENWAVAVEGWNARMAVNPAVGTRFSALYAAS